MYLVGLTGGIASGKSEVAQRLVEHGAELIDADEIAREVVLPGTETWAKIVEHFGSEVLDPDGFIDRPLLGRIVFSAEDKRALLNELTHPPVMAQIANRLELLAAFDGVVIVDVPLLVETGLGRGYEAILVVAAHPDTQIARLRTNRNLSEDEARARVAAQARLADRLAVATHVIWNEGSLRELRDEVDRVAKDLLARAAEKAELDSRAIPND